MNNSKYAKEINGTVKKIYLHSKYLNTIVCVREVSEYMLESRSAAGFIDFRAESA